jgi:23S rRNA (adenine2503-C2)-methyltransferase
MVRHLSGLAAKELEELAVQLGHKPFRGKQLFDHLHQRNATDLDDIAVLPAQFRQGLLEAGWGACSLTIAEVQRSSDKTVKLGLSTADGHLIESVLIPMDTGKFTQCISSQIGCALGCAVCMTGTLGLRRNLTAAEIVDQIRLAKRDFPECQVRNIVFMGMGEPLHNVDAVVAATKILQSPRGLMVSKRRLTVSTAGVIPGILRLSTEAEVLLAVSLNAPNQEIRERLMPIARKYPLDDLMATLKQWPLAPRQRLTLEYVMVAGINDQLEHARELVRLISHIRCKVNLIPFNPFPGTELQAPSEATIQAFFEALHAKDVRVTVRKSRGQDIQAACGQLAGSRANTCCER